MDVKREGETILYCTYIVIDDFHVWAGWKGCLCGVTAANDCKWFYDSFHLRIFIHPSFRASDLGCDRSLERLGGGMRGREALSIR